MYLCSSALLIVTAIAFTHFRLLVSPLDLVRQILAWILFTIPGAPDVNALNQTYLINTVFWSLVYEWKFYIVFPLLAVFALPRVHWYLMASVALCIWLYSAPPVEWFFLSGCVAASVTRTRIARVMARSPIWAIIALACIAATVKFEASVYTATGACLLFVPFVVVASGNSIFGLLTWRPARLLGLLSYSVYLVHNWVLYLLSRLVNHYTSIATMSERAYWLIGAVVVLVTVAIAAMTYRFIEYPFLRVSPRHKQESQVRTTFELDSQSAERRV